METDLLRLVNEGGGTVAVIVVVVVFIKFITQERRDAMVERKATLDLLTTSQNHVADAVRDAASTYSIALGQLTVHCRENRKRGDASQ